MECPIGSSDTQSGANCQEGLTTAELADLLQGFGFRASEESLRQDVHRKLISPLMPSGEVLGRGVPARWSAMAVRRALYMARLRKPRVNGHGVNGHVLPLLLFLRDGWGWKHILPRLMAATARSWELDRRYLNRPWKVQTDADLLSNAEADGPWQQLPQAEAFLLFRQWLWSMLWYGEPASGTMAVPAMLETLPAVLDVEVRPRERVELEVLARGWEQKRAALNLAAKNLPAWLLTLDSVAVERGRRCFCRYTRELRREKQKELRGKHGGTNPLTLGGMSPSEIAADLRKYRGRLTAANMLACAIAQAMVIAQMEEMEPPV
jgi:hypothetical protein